MTLHRTVARAVVFLTLLALPLAVAAQDGAIIIEKQTDPNGSPQSFEFATDYSPNFVLGDDETNNSGPLSAGVYSVSEVNIPPTWNLTSAVCDDGSDPSAIGLDPGETVVCIFVNTQVQPGVVIVEKQTDPDGSPQSFEFATDYGPNFVLGDDETNNSGPLSAGVYSVSEVNIPAGWTLTGAACDDGSDPSAIGLDSGETVRCVFFNMQQQEDYGDAPDSYGTLLASDGARHAVVAGYHLGPVVDGEPDGQPSPLADGDDLNPIGAADDEDGVVLPTILVPGSMADVTVDGGPSGGMLDGWIDFNANGLFDHPAEHLFGGASLVITPGPNPPIGFPVPATAVMGTTYARFRLSSTGGLTPTGFAPDGEVEDNLIDTVPVELMRFTIE